MGRLRDYLICILAALLLIYLQKFLVGSFTPYSGFTSSVGSYFLLALVSGFFFGLISCPVCGLPLSLSLASTENILLGVFFKNIIFHLGRFLIIFSYAYIGGVIIQSLNNFFYNLSFLLGGFLMALIGLGIILRVKLRLPFLFLGKGGVNPLFYLLLGLSLGFACGLEAGGFLVPLWLRAGSFFVRVMGGFIFSFSAILPTLIMSFLIYLGFEGAIFFFKERVRFFLTNTSGFFLLLFGVFFIVSFFRW